ncbi:VIT domain-containing protein [Nannocystis pusilla]|uniref:VIT domain-containing protein n=1 Tax=Nannocystis pusilla TaxID=889268 RepID=UPI003B786584
MVLVHGPRGCPLVSFALETNGQLVEGEIVERKQAAATYEAAVRRDNDPALLEWIDARTVRARIYPVPPAGERRVVLRYQQLMVESEGKRRYSYPLAARAGARRPASRSSRSRCSCAAGSSRTTTWRRSARRGCRPTAGR